MNRKNSNDYSVCVRFCIQVNAESILSGGNDLSLSGIIKNYIILYLIFETVVPHERTLKDLMVELGPPLALLFLCPRV